MRRLLPLILAFAMTTAALPALGVLDEDPLLTATIHYDEFGVPHIYADEAYALWYANGYVQGKTRLWAMDLLRHLSYGEGSSVVGPGGGILEMDVDVRQKLYSRAELHGMMDEVEQNDPIFLDVVQAYADGVNRAAAELFATGDVPAEFPALNHVFEPWEVIDTVAVAVFLLARFGNGGGSELGNAKLYQQLDAQLGPDAWAAFEDLLWFKADDTYSTIDPTDGVFIGTPQGEPKASFSALLPEQQVATALAADAERFGPAIPTDLPGTIDLPEDAFRFGSNALLVAPSHSETGKAMVGGGPQMGYFNPQVPFELGLHGAGVDAVGMGVTGAPGVIIGRIANMAWTVTSGISDQTDMVALPAAGERSYWWDGDEFALHCRTETHTLITPPALGQEPPRFVEQEVCLSQVGPITHITYDDNGEPLAFFAEHMFSRYKDLDGAVRWLGVSQATDMDDFRQRFDGFVFTFNFNMAGVDANGDEMVCYQHVGANPIRNPALDPRLPTPAGDAFAWTGVLTGPDLPQACNPTQGYFANWNNLPQQGWASGDSRELWGSVHRVERLDKAMRDALAADDNDKLDIDQVKQVLREAATHDSLASEIVDALLANDPGTAPIAMGLLAEWRAADFPWDATVVATDGSTVYAHRGHTVYDAILENLLEATFGDELDGFVRGVNLDPRDSSDPHAGGHGQHNNPFALAVNAFTGKTNRNWCDHVKTPTVETCADALALALHETGLDDVTSADDIARTEEHRSPFTSLGLGPSYTMPMTNRATFYHFHVGTDTTTSEATLPAGSTGHVNALDAMAILGGGSQGPEHMHDQLALYVNFQGKAMPFTQTQAIDLAARTQTLVIPG